MSRSRTALPNALLCAVLLNLCILPSAWAGPSMPYLRELVAQVGVPYWKKAVDQVRAAHNAAHGFEAAVWRDLDHEVDAATGAAPLLKTINPNSSQEITAYADWLRWRILAENADGRYSYAYAVDLSSMQDERGSYAAEAGAFYMHARLALAIDSARCAERTNAMRLMQAFEADEDVKPIARWVESLTGVKKVEVLLEAAAIEEMRGERPPLAWLCASATDTGKSPFTSINYLSAETTRYVSKARWRKTRRELIDGYLRGAMEALK